MRYGLNSNDHKVEFNKVKDILNFALDNNVNLLDTAPSYGNSELVLGDAAVQDFNIITKTRCFSKKFIEKKDVDALVNDLSQSLQLLKRENIYGLLVHNADDLLKPGSEKIFQQLNRFKQQGLVSKVGVSVYTENQIQEIIDRFDIDLIQLPFNIIDWRLVGTGILNKVYSKGIEIHARSVFLQGLLLMERGRIPKKFDRWDNLWRVWDEWLNDNKITALEATIRYAISTHEIKKVLVDDDSKRQLQEIVTSSKGHLPDIPKELFMSDINLLNPSNWSNL